MEDGRHLRADVVSPARPVSMIVWLILFFVLAYMLVPPSGYGVSSVLAWSDQSLYVRTADAAQSHTSFDNIIAGHVGVGYVALTLVIKKLLGIDASGALILLSRVSFFGAIALLIVLARQTITTTTFKQRAILAGCAALAVATPVSSMWSFFSDVPWTHFVVAALVSLLALVATLAFRAETTPVNRAIALTISGFLFGLIFQTRIFEGICLLAALIVGLSIRLGVTAIRGDIRRAFEPSAVLSRSALCLMGALVSYVVCGRIVGTYLSFGVFEGRPQNELQFALVPYKFVQLFIDPCYLTLCRVANYSPSDLWSWNIPALRMPLVMQMPAMVAIPAAFCVLVLASKTSRKFILEPEVLFPLLAGGGMVLLYVAAAPSGSPILAYGFFRDFVTPMLLFLIGYFALVARLIPSSGELRAIQASLITAAIILVGLMYSRTTGLPRITNKHLVDVVVTSNCHDHACNMEIVGLNPRFKAVRLPQVSLVTAHCKDRNIVSMQATPLKSLGACDTANIIPSILGMIETPTAADALKVSAEGNQRVFLVTPALELGRVYQFNAKTCDRPLLGTGWSDCEPWGTWSAAQRSEIGFRLDTAWTTDIVLDIHGRFFETAAFPQNEVTVRLGDTVVGLLHNQPDGNWRLRIPKDVAHPGLNVLSLTYRDVRTPRQLGVGSDKRTIAFGLETAVFNRP